ncbi:MAG: AMMECR1 domain-containing protein [bacterium]|nr:AMMECR1 domain-containing protein [bacterium]
MLKKFFSRANEFYYAEQLDAFFRWLAYKTFPESFYILIDLPLQREVVDANRKKVSKDNRTCVFIICQPNSRSSSEENWHQIWYAEGIEIWENKKIHRGALPLRFGLSLAEKGELLQFARKTMESFLGEENAVLEPDFPAYRANEKTMIDVSIWIDGHMRGSIISPHLPLIEAVQYASLGTMRDARMKPVEPGELERARIEITVMSDLTVPLRQQDLEAGKIDVCRGYYVEASGKRGWYLPTVFNCAKFKDMSDLKRSLIKEKAKITEEDSRIPIYTFRTESLIEDTAHDLMLMDGPVAYAPAPSAGSFLDAVRTHGDTAAQWLFGMIDTDGAMPLYIDPLYGRAGRIDWGRLANASYALAEFGIVTKNQECIRISKKISEYVCRYIFDTRKPSAVIDAGVSAYVLHAALARRDTDMSPLIGYLQENYTRIAYRPIMYAVLASLFARLTLEGKGEHRAESVSLAEKVFDDFKKNKELPGTQLALYPELIYTFQLIHSLTEEPLYLEQSEEVATWLISKQNMNGSFPSSNDVALPYTRGTGKIFEVLALYPDHYSNAIEKSFEWLVHMQYTEDSLYFTDPAFRKKAIGGFRHDHANTEAWIDSASHFLLGAARLLKAPVDK